MGKGMAGWEGSPVAGRQLWQAHGEGIARSSGTSFSATMWPYIIGCRMYCKCFVVNSGKILSFVSTLKILRWLRLQWFSEALCPTPRSGGEGENHLRSFATSFPKAENPHPAPRYSEGALGEWHTFKIISHLAQRCRPQCHLASLAAWSASLKASKKRRHLCSVENLGRLWTLKSFANNEGQNCSFHGSFWQRF